MSDDYTVINREIIIEAPIDKVFSAVSGQDELSNWFPDIADWKSGKEEEYLLNF
ncbi:MAG: hypothetical protein ABR515_02380 [Nitrososphaeraceae archaeon]